MSCKNKSIKIKTLKANYFCHKNILHKTMPSYYRFVCAFAW